MPVITGDEPPKKSGTRKGNPVRPAKAAEMELRRALFRLNRQLKTATLAIGAQIAGGAGPREIARQVERQLNESKRDYDAAADRLSRQFVDKLDSDNKAKIERAVKLAMGVDVLQIIDSPEVRNALDLALADNVRLIKSIPEVHFAKVSQAVMDNFRGLEFKEGSLTNRLRKIGGITDRRAKFMARDQMAKFVTDLNAIRQQDAGIDSYVWRNQGDRRVVGNPGGLYPKGSPQHMDHWHREGKVFKWSDPPPDGHPGQPIGCRCFAEPVIDLDKVQRNAVRI